MRVALFGATGTIGRATAHALLGEGHEVVCPVRSRAGFNRGLAGSAVRAALPGAELRSSDDGSLFSARSDFLRRERIDAVVSCLASRTGAPADAWAVDYQLHADLLQQARSAGVRHFVLLSAICVQKPLLAFQQAKLAFEKELADSGLGYSIVRPTAFFKSLSGQIRRVQQGKPFLVFGDGRLTACKPISDGDLARFLALCLTDPTRHNRILPVGGPGSAITPLEQGEYLFRRLGRQPRFRHVPVALLDVLIRALGAGGRWLPAWKEKAELARIGRYYATESMLAWDPVAQVYDADATPAFGNQTLFDYYDRLLSGEEAVELGDHAVF